MRYIKWFLTWKPIVQLAWIDKRVGKNPQVGGKTHVADTVSRKSNSIESFIKDSKKWCGPYDQGQKER